MALWKFLPLSGPRLHYLNAERGLMKRFGGRLGELGKAGGVGGAELPLTTVPIVSGPISEASRSCQEVASQGCPVDLGSSRGLSVVHLQGLWARSPREGPPGTRCAASLRRPVSRGRW